MILKKSQKFYEKYHYDLIVCQDPFITGSLGAQLKKKFGPKLIIHFHGDFLDNPYWLQENFRHRVYKKMAEIKNLDYDILLKSVESNFKRIFKTSF